MPWDKIKQVIGVQFQCDIFVSINRKGPYFISAVVVEIISRNWVKSSLQFSRVVVLFKSSLIEVDHREICIINLYEVKASEVI